MAKFSIMLFGIDSYTKNKMQLPYKLDAKSSDAALREARMCAMTFYPRFGLAEIFEKIIGNVQFLAEEPITETGRQFIRNVNAVGIVFCTAD